MAKELKFDPEDEEFFGSVGSFGVPKFDNASSHLLLKNRIIQF